MNASKTLPKITIGISEYTIYDGILALQSTKLTKEDLNAIKNHPDISIFHYHIDSASRGQIASFALALFYEPKKLHHVTISVSTLLEPKDNLEKLKENSLINLLKIHLLQNPNLTLKTRPDIALTPYMNQRNAQIGAGLTLLGLVAGGIVGFLTTTGIGLAIAAMGFVVGCYHYSKYNNKVIDLTEKKVSFAKQIDAQTQTSKTTRTPD